MKIRNYELNDQLIIELGKFTILWNYFEKTFCNNNCNNRKIKEICSSVDIDEKKMSALAQTLNRRRDYYNIAIPDYIQDGLFPDGSIQSLDEDKEIMKSFLEDEGYTSKSGCLLIIFRIRNNMMHGLKQIEDLNDQLDLFIAVNGVLESIEVK